MYVSFGSRLRRMSGIRFGFRFRGPAAAVMAIFYGMFYACWYMFLGTLWLMYGCYWLMWKFCVWCIYKPCAALVRWIARKIKK